MAMLGAPECLTMRIFWVHLDVKGKVKVHKLNETTNRNLPWCLEFVPFPTVGKKKWYIDEYGHKILNSFGGISFFAHGKKTQFSP